MSKRLAAAVVAVLDREARLAEAEHRSRPWETAPEPTPGRPGWWDRLSPAMRDLAAEAERAGVWSLDRVDSAWRPIGDVAREIVERAQGDE